MDFSREENILVVLSVSVLITTGFYFNYEMNLPPAVAENKNVLTASLNQSINPTPPPPPQKLINPPSIIKSVYMTGYSAGTKSYLRYLQSFLKKTDVNAVVVDIKGSDGYVTYNSEAEDVKKYNLNNDAISDIDSLVNFFHGQNIYVIGRIAVFEDPMFARARPDLAIHDKTGLWKDNNGLSWLDPSSKDTWDYDISLAKDALQNHGFDEINFDYVRFPTDGKTASMIFPLYDGKELKADVIKNFFDYVRMQLRGEKISVDLFGQTTVSTNDMGIGQLIENAFVDFDYVCPMVYPSHYANGFIGFKNPAEHPYEVIKYSLDKAVIKRNVQMASISFPEVSGKIRPWLQDFNIGAEYDTKMVDQEIKASQDSLGSNYAGFMLWNPSNIYTTY